MKKRIGVMVILVSILILSFFSKEFRFFVCMFLPIVMGFGCFWIGKFKNPLRALSVYSIFAQGITLFLYSLLNVVINDKEVRYMSLVLASPLDYWFVLIYIFNALILMVVFSSRKAWKISRANIGNNLTSLLGIINLILSFAIMISFAWTTERHVIAYSLDDDIFIMSMFAGMSTSLPQIFFLQLLGGETISEEQKRLLPSDIRLFQDKYDKVLERLIEEGEIERKKVKENKPYEKGSLRYYLAWFSIISLIAFFIGIQGWAFLDIISKRWLLQPAVWIGAIFWSIYGYYLIYALLEKGRQGQFVISLSLLSMPIILVFIGRISPIGSQFLTMIFLVFVFGLVRVVVEIRKGNKNR